MPTNNNTHKRAAINALCEAESALRALISGLEEAGTGDILADLEACRSMVDDVQILLRETVGPACERLPESCEDLCETGKAV